MAIRNLQFVLSGKDAGASKAIRGVGKQAESTSSKIGSLAGAFAGGALATGAIQFGKASVAAFMESEKSAAQLAFAFERFPKLADSNAKAFEKINTALARKTKFDDDALASGQAVIAQFGLTGKQIEKVTPLLADFAAKTGQELPDAAKALGMAFNGNTRALKAIGINYKSTGDRAKDFENIQRLVRAQVGGFAEGEGKTAAGQLAILQNQYGEVQEQVGAKLLPVLVSLGQQLLATIDFVQRNEEVIKPLVIVVGTLGTAVVAVNTAMKIATATSLAYTTVSNGLAFAFGRQAVTAGTAATATTGLAAAQTAAAGTAGTSAVASAGAAAGFTSIGSAARGAIGVLGRLAKVLGVVGIAYGLFNAAKNGLQGKDSQGNKVQPLEITNRNDKRQGTPKPITGRNGDDYRRPRGGLVVGTVDNKRLSSATANAQQGRVARGFLAPGY